MSSERARSTRAWARPGDRETTVTCHTGRTARIAMRCPLAWTPAPKITSRSASWLARCRVASPETAAVRSAVNAAPSMTAAGSLVPGANKTYTAWISGRPRFGFEGLTVTSLIPVPGSPTAGISNSSAPSASTDVRRGDRGSRGALNPASSASIAASIGRARSSPTASISRKPAPGTPSQLPQVCLPHEGIVQEVLGRVGQHDLSGLEHVPTVGDG